MNRGGKLLSLMFFAWLIAWSNVAAADVANLDPAGDRMMVLSVQDGQLWQGSCAASTIGATLGDCHDKAQTANLANVRQATEIGFGQDIEKFANEARQWAVEVSSVDAKILELLSATPAPTSETQALALAVKQLSLNLVQLEEQAKAIADQITAIEISLPQHMDGDSFALLAALQAKKVEVDRQRQDVATQLAVLRTRLLAARSSILDVQVFDMVMTQRQEAVSAFGAALVRQAAEEGRRMAYDRALGLIADSGFTYRLAATSSEPEATIAAAVYAIELELTAEWTAKITPSVHADAPQYVSCVGGLDSFCGIRARLLVPVPARLAGLNCMVVGAPTNCYQLTAFKADDQNELIAVEGTVLETPTSSAAWTPVGYGTSAAWTVAAQGAWIVIAKCQNPGPENNADLHFPGRLSCEAQLRGP